MSNLAPSHSIYYLTLKQIKERGQRVLVVQAQMQELHVKKAHILYLLLKIVMVNQNQIIEMDLNQYNQVQTV